MSGSFRRSILAHRIHLERVWPLAWPKHDFASLRLIQPPPSRAETHWETEGWKKAAIEYHNERRQQQRS
jgi:hypothetical protein